MKTHRNSLLLATAVAAVFSTLLSFPDAAQAQKKYGSVTGQFTYDAKQPPKPVVERKKGDPNVKDSAVCAAAEHLENDLVVDKETMGIKNVFIYIREFDQKDVHPNLKNPKVKELEFDQKGCRFEPHAMFVRTTQTVKVLSNDPIAHNAHTYPIRNKSVNFLLRPKDRVGVKVQNPQSEILPFQVKCDIHPWMTSYWLVLDHPYAAITDEQGKFKIENLPEGKHEFRVWHERVGYIDRKYKVEVKAGKMTELAPVAVDPKKF